MSISFFCCFLKHTLAKPKKNDIQKNEHFPASIKTRIKKCQYTLRKKNHIFEKSPLPAILCDFTLLTIIEHAFSIFYQKKIDKFTILHRNFVFFSIFFRITICKPNLICRKCVINTFAKYFFHFPAKSPYIEQILGKKMYIVKYTADFG